MAKLHRMVRLDDRSETSVFTFLVPCTSFLQRSSLQDNFARDFDHGCHRWTFLVARTPTHLDLNVSLKSGSKYVSVEVDLAFVLINQDHYTRNEKGRLLKVRFNSDCDTHGLKNFCSLDDLERGNFRALQGTGWFVIELEMKNQKSFFEQALKLAESPEKNAKNRSRYETSYFSFGNFDWSILIFPSGDSDDVDGRFVTSINRLSSFDNICKIRYDVTVDVTSSSSSSSSSSFQSDGTIESMVDASGKSRFPHQLQRRQRLEDSICKGGIFSFRSQTTSGSGGSMNVRLLLRSCSVVGEATLRPFVPGKNRVRMYDREEQAWTLETDVSVDRLLLRLYYDDVSHVPRGHVRRVTWSVSVLPAIGHSLSAISGGLVSGGSSQVRVGGGNQVVGETRSCYYVQTDVDDGQSVTTDVPTAELRHSGVYLEEKDGGQMTLHLEWIDSHLLFMDRWQLSDDVIVKQRHQMRQELASLEAENLALEKQVHLYQMSLNKNTTDVGPGYQFNHDAGPNSTKSNDVI